MSDWELCIVILIFSGLCYLLGTKHVPPDRGDDRSTLPLASALPPKHNITVPNMQAAWSDFVAIVGKENVLSSDSATAAYAGSDWSSYDAPDSQRPKYVVTPATTEEVSRVVAVCHERRIPITPYSGGTSLEGHFAATRGGICISLERMNQIIAIRKEDMDCTVQPGVGWEDLNAELAGQSLFFPPDPGPGAKIGGMIGTGCSGTNASYYGTIREWVINLTVVLADGTTITTRQRPRKSSAGYDLTKLLIGSEGTLGIVTEATLKLTSKPQNESVAVASFPSIRAAAAAASALVAHGISPAAVEILDDVSMRCLNDSGSITRHWPELPTLFFKFCGPTRAGVQEQIVQVLRLATSSGSSSFQLARSPAEAVELWEARKQALFSVMALRRNGTERVWTTDVAVPISRLPEIVEQTKADLAANGLRAGIVGHVGDGNFHAVIVFEGGAADGGGERQRVEAVVHRMVKRAVEMEGTVTGEHGVGLVKRDYLEHELGVGAVDLMRKIKQALDPECILNCDKVVRSEMPGKGEVSEW